MRVENVKKVCDIINGLSIVYFYKTDLENLKRWPLEPEKCDEHENQEDATCQLKVLFRLVLA